jgi:CobQ-like glutamine amidotransferase family enzyme
MDYIKMSNKSYQLTIGWLYPELMSTYGDRGNIIVLQKRCEWRGIKVEIIKIDQTTTDQKLKTVDLLFGGGAQDREQEIVIQNLQKKRKTIKELIEKNIPALFVCGAPQLMGKYYEPAEGKRIEGLGIFDMTTKHPGPNQPRLIGNVVAKIIDKNILNTKHLIQNTAMVVGFENHGGRTYLGENGKPFAKVIKGYGNNGEDGTEGVVYKNAIGCYLHGPLLPKNPHIADYLITKALEVKYKEKIELKTLDDSLELQAQEAILKKLEVNF